MKMTDDALTALLSPIADIIRAHPAGLSEVQLLRILREQHPQAPMSGRHEDSLSLFRSHFLLFHSLYLLQQQLADNRQGRLEIAPLKIVLTDLQPPGAHLAEADPLRNYYLDLDNLEHTSGADVDKMLEAFWRKYLGSDKRREALAILGLEDPVDDATIKKRYRKLAMEHHPDRGGDTLQLQAIHDAIRVLLG
jgi:DnaJ-domain-containing protein 1